MPIATETSDEAVFELDETSESTDTVAQETIPPFDTGKHDPVDSLNFTPHSQIDISEAGESYRVRDSETGATSEGDTRGKALASLAAKLISGDHSQRNRTELFDLAGTSDREHSKRIKEGAGKAADTDYHKSRDIEIGQDDS